MTTSINHVVLTGKVADPGPKLTYSATSAKPECRLTVVVEEGKGDQVFSFIRQDNIGYMSNGRT